MICSECLLLPVRQVSGTPLQARNREEKNPPLPAQSQSRGQMRTARALSPTALKEKPPLGPWEFRGGVHGN